MDIDKSLRLTFIMRADWFGRQKIKRPLWTRLFADADRERCRPRKYIWCSHTHRQQPNWNENLSDWFFCMLALLPLILMAILGNTQFLNHWGFPFSFRFNSCLLRNCSSALCYERARTTSIQPNSSYRCRFPKPNAMSLWPPMLIFSIKMIIAFVKDILIYVFEKKCVFFRCVFIILLFPFVFVVIVVSWQF